MSEGGERKKPCRVCLDFKSWMRAKTKAAAEGEGGATPPATDADVSAPSAAAERGVRHADCPLDKDELGRASWNLLHTMAATFPEQPSASEQRDAKDFLTLFSRLYPCDFCAKDMRDDLRAAPPDTSSQDKFAQWMCRLHNGVNSKLGKPQFDCANVQQRWRDGWPDGSCG